MAKDHPRGEEPITIKDHRKDLAKFKEALDLVKVEKQVLILVNSIFPEYAHKIIAAQLPKDSFTEHYGDKYDNDKASAWVEYHMTRQEEDVTNDNFKFLIGDWVTTAGYEVPALIFLTNDITNANHATHVQRAKAKLIIYHSTSW